MAHPLDDILRILLPLRKHGQQWRISAELVTLKEGAERSDAICRVHVNRMACSVTGTGVTFLEAATEAREQLRAEMEALERQGEEAIVEVRAEIEALQTARAALAGG